MPLAAAGLAVGGLAGGAGSAAAYELPTSERAAFAALTEVSDLTQATDEVFGWPFHAHNVSLVMVSDGNEVGQLHDIIGYDLDLVRGGAVAVPRLYLAAFPPGWGDVATIAERKALFFRSFLPLILRVNEAIMADRAILRDMRDRLGAGVIPSAGEMDWLIDLALLYRVLPPEAGEDGAAVALTLDDIETLLGRVDVIPPSLAMAQAVEESGWGRSRFAREGNAMFGQYTWDNTGIVPLRRASGASHSIKQFDSLLQSVAAYALNLNAFSAYGEFRAERARMRAAGEPLDGRALVSTLTRYSVQPGVYMRALRTTIDANELWDFDAAVLAPGAPIHVQPVRF